MAKYFSARVSSKDQNLARQLAEAEKYGIPKENVFCDKITGRKTDRPEYDRMKNMLRRVTRCILRSLTVSAVRNT